MEKKMIKIVVQAFKREDGPQRATKGFRKLKNFTLVRCLGSDSRQKKAKGKFQRSLLLMLADF